MKARLFSLPASHPAWTARLLLEHKRIPYSRIDLVPMASKLILRAAGFPGTTVPALKIDGTRVQGSRAIAAELDRLVPDPPLFPTDPEARVRVEEAERWGDEVLQPVPRRLVWGTLSRDRSPVRSYLAEAKLGLPTSVAVATTPPIIAMARRYNEATDVRLQADLAALPGLVDQVDAYIAEGVLGGAEPNAADFQIASSIALLLTLDDVRPLFAGRPAKELAERIAPGFPGHAPPTLPAPWLEPLRAAETS